MKQVRGFFMIMGVVALAAAFSTAACSTGYTPKNAPETFDCVPEAELVKDIAPEAELASLSCAFKAYEGVPTLHLTAKVKNLSSQDQRFRVHIFLDGGKAVGGLVPEQIAKGLVKPGDTATFVYPVMAMPRQPKSVTVRIRTVGE